jgi:hypothetical protein
MGAALLAMEGCDTDWQRRGQDALNMVDVGITVSETPYLSLYACGGGLITVGAGHFDGYLMGIGGGQVGTIRHYEKTLGLLLWAYEELGWGDHFDVNKQETLYTQHVAILGWLTELPRRPPYSPACVHCFHFGYVGLILNVRYFEILDFMAGWFGADLAGDNENPYGKWPWQDDFSGNIPQRVKLDY